MDLFPHTTLPNPSLRLRSSFQNIQHGINGLSPDEDLKRYADTRGTGMEMNWPTFTGAVWDSQASAPLMAGMQVSAEPRHFLFNLGDAQHSHMVPTEPSACPVIWGTSPDIRASICNCYPPIGRMAMKDTEPEASHYPVYSDPPAKKTPFNGFEDGDSEWGDTLPSAAHHTPAPPTSEVKVMAMFDYNGAEADELSFKEGDVLVQLDEEDENGWCRGRYQGVEGLYPASYVQRVKELVRFKRLDLRFLEIQDLTLYLSPSEEFRSLSLPLPPYLPLFLFMRVCPHIMLYICILHMISKCCHFLFNLGDAQHSHMVPTEPSACPVIWGTSPDIRASICNCYPPIGRMAMKDTEPEASHYPVYSDPPAKKTPFNGFEDGDSEWGDTLPSAAHHTPAPPTSEVKVMAMFDYNGAEADELSFKEGDVLVQLDEEDENGWCRGRYQGVEGLYPASYVQRVKELVRFKRLDLRFLEIKGRVRS
eukprot:sb/3464307/